MLYDIFAIVIVALSLIIGVSALKLLFKRGWFLAWLKGTVGFSLVCLAVLVALSSWDIYRYEEILEESSIATISFEKQAEQHYRATLVSSSGDESVYELRGDQWQLDAKVFKWSSKLTSVGLKPGYRLDRLAGRYYSLDKERLAQRTVYGLNESLLDVDVWLWCKSLGDNIPWLDTVYGSATFVPMSDGALYEVLLTHSGLIARPLNERAQTAVARWQ